MSEPICSKRSPPRPQHPIFSVFRQGGLQFEHSVRHTHRQTGEITTIDPRHAGDTPTETFYGSNSPPPGAGRRWAAWTPRWHSGPYRAGAGRRPEGRGPARAHTATATITTTGN